MMLRILLLGVLTIAGALACDPAPPTTETTGQRSPAPAATEEHSQEAAGPEPISSKVVPQSAVTSEPVPESTSSTPEPTRTTEQNWEYIRTKLPRREGTVITHGEGPSGRSCNKTPWGKKAERYSPGNMVWRPDGSSVLFISGQNIWEAQTDGSGVRRLIDPNPPPEPEGRRPSGGFNFHIDLSPDGSQMVYSTCEYPVYHPRERPKYGYWTKEPTSNEEGRLTREYELAIINLETLEKRRLTHDRVMNHLPAWSPDGSKVAYLTNSQSPLEDSRSLFLSGDIYLAVITPESDRDPVQPQQWTNYDYSFPPVWSPDGRYIAMPSYEHHPSEKSAVNVLPANDLSSRTRLGETTTQPAWSPDSVKIAFANEQEIYTVNPDGTELKHIWTEENHINHLDWHPDGSEILVSALRLFTITPEGEEIRTLAGPAGPEIRALAGAEASAFRNLGTNDFPIFERVIWSPDGTELAAAIWQIENPTQKFQITSISREGSEVQTLALAPKIGTVYLSSDREMLSPNPPRTSNDRYDASACDDPKVVDQNTGPKLIEDCRTLLEIASQMALNEPLNWSGELPITEWEGITLGEVDGELRVERLHLPNRHLGGSIPPQIGELKGLKALNFSREGEEYRGNLLTGSIPPEIGNLSSLIFLNLSRNNLTGTVPESLNRLTNLRYLNVSHNYLRGCVSTFLAQQITREKLFRLLKDEEDVIEGLVAAYSGLSICAAEE